MKSKAYLVNTELEPLRFFYDTVQPILLRRKLLSHEQILNLGQVSEFFLLHLIFKLKTLDAFFKIQGDIFIIDKRKYKIYSPPLRDNSGMVWKIQAVGV